MGKALLLDAVAPNGENSSTLSVAVWCPMGVGGGSCRLVLQGKAARDFLGSQVFFLYATAVSFAFVAEQGPVVILLRVPHFSLELLQLR